MRPPTERITWIAHCLAHLKRQYESGTPLGSRAPLSEAGYVRMIQRILREYREE